jgi:hypothetical protein
MVRASWPAWVVAAAFLVGPSAGDPLGAGFAPLPPLASIFGRAPVVSSGVGSSPSADGVASVVAASHHQGLGGGALRPSPSLPPPLMLPGGSKTVAAEGVSALPVGGEDGVDDHHSQPADLHDVPARRAQDRTPEVCLAFLSCCGRTDLLETTLAAAVREGCAKCQRCIFS